LGIYVEKAAILKGAIEVDQEIAKHY